MVVLTDLSFHKLKMEELYCFIFLSSKKKIEIKKNSIKSKKK